MISIRSRIPSRIPATHQYSPALPCTLASGRPLVSSRLLWIVAGLLALAFSACTPQRNTATRADQGILDAREALEGGVLALEGTWKALGGADSTHFADFDYDDRHWQSVARPGLFTDQGFSNDGLVWYRLRLRLPQNVAVKGFIEYAGYAHTLYVARPGQAGHAIAASGRPALTADAAVLSRRPVSFTLPADTALVLAWQVANFDYLQGGPFYPIYLGEAAAIDAVLTWQTSVVFAYACLYLLIAFFFLLNWYWYRDDQQALSSSLFALAMILRTVAVSGLLDTYFPALISYGFRIWFEGASFFLLISACGLLLWSFFPKEFTLVRVGRVTIRPPTIMMIGRHDEHAARPLLPRWLRRLNTAAALTAMGSGVLLTVVTAFTRPLTLAYILEVYRWVTLAMVVLALGIVLQAVERRRPFAAGMLLGFSLILVAGIHDVLAAMWVIDSGVYLATHAFLGFVLVQTYVLAHRNARYAQDLRTATKAAQVATLAKSQFVTAVSHELRTPLTAINGFAQILQDELKAHSTPHQNDFFQTIRESSDRVLMLVNDLLDLAKVESGKLDLTLMPVEVNALVKDVLRQLFPLADHKDLTLTVATPGGALWVQADALRLRQVLINLVSNAIKFTEAGDVTIQVARTKLHEQPAGAIIVEDTGVGIAPEFLPRLFDQFTQEQRAYSDTQRGTGLGLALSRELIHGMHGAIKATSEVGVGSRFTVTLPCAKPPPPIARPLSTESKEARKRTPGEPERLRHGKPSS